jgi:hypothetical protein
MTRSLTALFALAAVALLAAQPAKAQRICGEHQKIVAKLAEKYREKPEAMGVAADGSLLQVMVSPQGGWTILVTSPRRVTCVVAAGKDWQSQLKIAVQNS